MKTIFDELKQEVKNWWVSLILGILYVAVALGLMFFPFNGYAALSILFSISMLVSGLLARAVIVVGKDGKIAYTELVPEITQEPDYEKAIAAVRK